MKKLQSQKISELFYNCFFEDNEIINGRPIGEFTSIKSINPNKNITVLLSTMKLNKNKNIIIEYIDLLPKIDEGNSLDNLCFDRNGNKWCEDIQILDQLLMMALACQLISYTTLELKDEEIVTIKRIRENDNFKVSGISPEVIPETKDNQLSKGYNEKEKQLIAENKIRITEELNEYYKIINTGLGFFRIHAIINTDNVNQLDFYDNKDNFLFSRKFADTDGIVGLEGILNQRLFCEFKDRFENKITYLVDGKRHLFLLSSPEDKRYGYKIEITRDNNKEHYSRIQICIGDANSNYVFKKIEVNDESLQIELNNQFGPYGNHVDGEKRLIWYRPLHDPLLYVIEDEWYQKGHCLRGSCSEVKLDGETLIGRLTREQFYKLSTNIVLHSRNKELILYTIEEMEKQLPGIKEFIYNNSVLYNFIINAEYQSDPITDELVQATIHEKCNLKNSGKSAIKKR